MARIPRLVGPHEVGDMLGVNRQRVYQLSSRPDFPAPAARLRQGTVWVAADIEKWARKRGRTIHAY